MVRAFAFDGDEVKYSSWEGNKTLALASSKGFLLALTRESTGRALMVEQFKYGEVEVTLQSCLRRRQRQRIVGAWPGHQLGHIWLQQDVPTRPMHLSKGAKGIRSWHGPYYKRSTVLPMQKRITPSWIKRLATANLLGCRRTQSYGPMTWTI